MRLVNLRHDRIIDVLERKLLEKNHEMKVVKNRSMAYINQPQILNDHTLIREGIPGEI